MSHQRFLDRNTHPHIITLVMATAFGALAMNLFLPALPSMARYFNAPYSTAQYAVSLYLAATAVMQLGIGPLSDRFGRRPLMAACLAISLLATLAGIYATTIEWFLTARIVQGTAIAGMVIGRAAIRDVVDTDQAASKIGYVTMGMSLAPMVGPVIGGLLDEQFGWQSTFWLLFGFGLVAFLLVWFDMGKPIPTFPAASPAISQLARPAALAPLLGLFAYLRLRLRHLLRLSGRRTIFGD
ncbi:MAG: MFS transporter [Nitratireductor sp.]